MSVPTRPLMLPVSDTIHLIAVSRGPPQRLCITIAKDLPTRHFAVVPFGRCRRVTR